MMLVDEVIRYDDNQWDWNRVDSIFTINNWDMKEWNQNGTCYPSETYIKERTKIFHDIIYDELIEKSCHPSRLVNFHDNASEILPNEYRIEYEKWKN